MKTTEGTEYENSVALMYALTFDGKIVFISKEGGQAHIYHSRKDAEFMKQMAKSISNIDCQIEEVAVVRRVRKE